MLLIVIAWYFVTAQRSRLFIGTNGAMGTSDAIKPVRASLSIWILTSDLCLLNWKTMEPSPVAKRAMPEQLQFFYELLKRGNVTGRAVK